MSHDSSKSKIVRFQCTSCRGELSVPASMAGRSGRCPNCKETITVPDIVDSQAWRSTGPPRRPPRIRKPDAVKRKSNSPSVSGKHDDLRKIQKDQVGLKQPAAGDQMLLEHSTGRRPQLTTVNATNQLWTWFGKMLPGVLVFGLVLWLVHPEARGANFLALLLIWAFGVVFTGFLGLCLWLGGKIGAVTESHSTVTRNISPGTEATETQQVPAAGASPLSVTCMCGAHHRIDRRDLDNQARCSACGRVLQGGDSHQK